jgi:hypothetical protein
MRADDQAQHPGSITIMYGVPRTPTAMLRGLPTRIPPLLHPLPLLTHHPIMPNPAVNPTAASRKSGKSLASTVSRCIVQEEWYSAQRQRSLVPNLSSAHVLYERLYIDISIMFDTNSEKRVVTVSASDPSKKLSSPHLSVSDLRIYISGALDQENLSSYVSPFHERG